MSELPAAVTGWPEVKILRCGLLPTLVCKPMAQEKAMSKFPDLEQLATQHGATFCYAEGGNFAAFHFEKLNGDFLRVDVRANTYQPASTLEIEKAKRLVLFVIDMPWQRKPESNNGVFSMLTWEYDEQDIPRLKPHVFGEEIAETYYQKARALMDTAPEESVPYSLFYLSVLARQGRLK